MNAKMPRRDFIKAAPVAAYALAQTARGATLQAPDSTTAAARLKIEPFDYHGVRLRESRWQKQYQAARDFYFGVSDDDILHGYRAAAGLPAPGKPLGGWCAQNSDTVFGQWLSGMSRMCRATGDTAVRDKVVVPAHRVGQDRASRDGNCGMAPLSL